MKGRYEHSDTHVSQRGTSTNSNKYQITDTRSAYVTKHCCLDTLNNTKNAIIDKIINRQIISKTDKTGLKCDYTQHSLTLLITQGDVDE